MKEFHRYYQLNKLITEVNNFIFALIIITQLSHGLTGTNKSIRK
jgi:hypothetical protein